MPAITVFDGTDQSCLELCSFEYGAQEPGGGGLAVGSRDAGECELFCGEALLGHGQPCERFAGIADDALGQSDLGERPFRDDCLRPCSGGGCCEGVAVAACSAQRNEDVTALQPTTVGAEAVGREVTAAEKGNGAGD